MDNEFEAVYKNYVNDIYRICLHFLKDEKRAADITVQVFFNFYNKFQEVDSDYRFAHLVRETKMLIAQEQTESYATGEMRYE